MRSILEDVNDAASQNAAATVDLLGEKIARRPGTEVESISGEEGRKEAGSWAKQLVARETEIFASGGTEMQNFASLAGGASVVEGNTFTSPSMVFVDRGLRRYAAKLFGPCKDQPHGRADEALSISTGLGHCFAFRGGKARLTVKLGKPGSSDPEGGDMAVFVAVSHIFIAHATVTATPSAARSAPRRFRVLGWDSDPTASSTQSPRVFLAEAQFSVDRDAPAIQTFTTSPGGVVRSSPSPVGWVTLELAANHGGPRWNGLFC